MKVNDVRLYSSKECCSVKIVLRLLPLGFLLLFFSFFNAMWRMPLGDIKDVEGFICERFEEVIEGTMNGNVVLNF